MDDLPDIVQDTTQRKLDWHSQLAKYIKGKVGVIVPADITRNAAKEYYGFPRNTKTTTAVEFYVLAVQDFLRTHHHLTEESIHKTLPTFDTDDFWVLYEQLMGKGTSIIIRSKQALMLARAEDPVPTPQARLRFQNLQSRKRPSLAAATQPKKKRGATEGLALELYKALFAQVEDELKSAVINAFKTYPERQNPKTVIEVADEFIDKEWTNKKVAQLNRNHQLEHDAQWYRNKERKFNRKEDGGVTQKEVMEALEKLNDTPHQSTPGPAEVDVDDFLNLEMFEGSQQAASSS
jgi:hypothetical protein